MTTGRVQSVERAARVLLAFERLGDPPTVGGIAVELGVHKSTASRIVATLVEHELLAIDEDDQQLSLGPAWRRLADIADGQPDLAERARPVIDQLAADTGETATLALPSGNQVTTVAQSSARHLVGANSWVGLRAPAHATSDGKVLLAHAAVLLTDALLPRCTPATIVNRATLAAQLDEVRVRGWASSTGEYEVGLNGVAVPVFDRRGRCRAALCVAGPEYRIGPDRFAALADACTRAAKSLVTTLYAQSRSPFRTRLEENVA